MPDFGMTGKVISAFGDGGWLVLDAMGLDPQEIKRLCDGFLKTWRQR